MHKIELSENGRVVTLMVDSTAPVKFHAIWLRDNAWDGETRAPGNGQRLIALRDIPSDIYIEHAKIEDQVLTLTFQPEDKTVEYDIDWLVTHSYDGAEKHASGWTASYVETWDAGLMKNVPVADFEKAQNDPAVLRNWAMQLTPAPTRCCV